MDQAPPPQEAQEEYPTTIDPKEMSDFHRNYGCQYVCGDCGTLQRVKQNDPVRCHACGYRILYKVRTKRLIQFEAR